MYMTTSAVGEPRV